MKKHWFISILLSVLAILPLSTVARADGIQLSISGAAQANGGDLGGGFGFSGPGVIAFGSSIFHPSNFVQCKPGAMCDFVVSVDTDLSMGVCCVDDSFGSVLGIDANKLGGGLIFTGSMFVPSNFTVGALSAPAVTVAGDVEGFNQTFDGFLFHQTLLWSLDVSGAGEGSLSAIGFDGFNVIFNSADFTYTGSASPTLPTPEPTSFLLFGTGLLGIVLISRRMLVH